MVCEPSFSKPSENWTVCCQQLEFGGCRRSGLCRPTQTRNRRCKLAICHHRLTKYSSCAKPQHAPIEITRVSSLSVITDSSSTRHVARSSGKVHARSDHINFTVVSLYFPTREALQPMRAVGLVAVEKERKGPV